MSALEAEVFEASRSADVPEDKAIKAAAASSAALAKVEDETTRGFNERDADIEVTRKDVQVLETDMAVLKCMVGFDLAMTLAVLFKLFAHRASAPTRPVSP